MWLSYLCFQIAEDDDGVNQDWDALSNVAISVDVDNSGTFTDLLVFEGTGGNSEPLLDTDCDGTGDGAALTNTFTTYCVAVPSTGTDLDIQVTVSSLVNGDEDVAMDAFSLYSGSGSLPVAATAACPPPLTCPAVGDLYVSEIMYNPNGSDAGCEYIESFNGYNNTVDLGGWSLSNGVSFTFPAGTMIPSGGYVVVTNSLPGVCVGYDLTASTFIFSGTLSNTSETIELSSNATCGSPSIATSATYLATDGANGNANSY